jgi:diguanylate cyclase
LKRWIQKFVDQLSVTEPSRPTSVSPALELTEERATILYFLDVYSKHLMDTENHSARKVRETLDAFARNLLQYDDEKLEKNLFQLRQFFLSHRVDEYTYTQNTLNEFRKIIWDLVAHLSDEMAADENEDLHLSENLENLRDAVESNSVNLIKSHSKQFIENYLKKQNKKEERKTKRIAAFKKNLSTVKKQLIDANSSLQLDHLTKAYNRKSFDEQLKCQWDLFRLTKQPVTLIMLDIDYFKRINDNYGHAVGDFVLVECVKLLKELFPRDVDAICRVGGEEFAIILPDYQLDHAMKKAEAALIKIRGETIVEQDKKINFSVSMGIAQLLPEESIEKWMKRADSALYESKKSGRDRYTIAPHKQLIQVA